MDLLSGLIAFGFIVAGAFASQLALGIVLGAGSGAFLMTVLRYRVRARDARQAGEAEAEEQRSAELALFAGGRLPDTVAATLRDDGAYNVGVDHEAVEVLAALGEPGRDREYVPRDLDRRLREWLGGTLRSPGGETIVLDGVAKAGKSRTLLTALAATHSDALLVRPSSPAALASLLRKPPPALDGRPAVIWLDDLEDWLIAVDDPLTLELVEQVGAWSFPVLFAGTVGGRGLTRVRRGAGGREPEATEPVKHFINGLRARAGTLVTTLPAEHSDAELERLEARYGPGASERIQEAGGLGSYLIAGPHLLDRLRDAPPSAAALVTAAINWRRLGMLRPVPRAVLDDLQRHCLTPPHKSEESTTAALIWAMEPVYGARLLLARVDRDGAEAYEPLDFIVSRANVEPPSPAFVERVSDEAEPAELVSMGAMLIFLHMDLDAASVILHKADERGEGLGSYNLGVLLEQMGDAEGAMEAYRRAEKRGSVRATFQIGVLQQDGGEEDEAFATFERADAAGSPEAAHNLGVLLEQRDDVSGALAAYRRAEERGLPEASLNIGVLLEKQDDPEGAMAAYEQAEAGGDPEATFNIARLHAKQGDTKTAKAVYRRAVRDGSTRAPLNLGVMLQREGDVDGALEMYEIGDERGDAEASFNLGTVLGDRGKRVEAVHALERAEARGKVDAAVNLGGLLLRRRDRDGAEEAFRRADASGSALGAYNLGMLLQSSDRLPQAEQAFLRGEARGSMEAAMALGRLLILYQDFDRAEAVFLRAEEQGCAEAPALRAAVYLLLHQNDRAEEAFRVGAELGDPGATLGLGAVLASRGESREAMDVLRRAEALGEGKATKMIRDLREQYGDALD